MNEPKPANGENLGPKPEFLAMLENRWEQNNLVCVGLDSDYGSIPEVVRFDNSNIAEAMFDFNRQIIDATQEFACAIKPNAAFYEAQGEMGHRALVRTVKYIHEVYPGIPVILDAKRGDIKSTNLGYIESVFTDVGADAVTINPYLGRVALQPFLDRTDKGIILLVKTSNPGSGEFQDLPVGPEQKPLYQVVAQHIQEAWNVNGNCGMVIGATYPSELAEVRAIAPDVPFLIPGIGAQGGEVEATVTAGKDSRGAGMIINSSRGIIFASKGQDFADAAHKAAEQLWTEINKYR
jgi:orotidine-5'-phosphate decarboxylase